MNVLEYAEVLKFDNQISRGNYRILSLEDESRMRMLAITLISVVVETRILII